MSIEPNRRRPLAGVRIVDLTSIVRSATARPATLTLASPRQPT